MLDLLKQGQVLLYFNDPRAQSALENIRWDGAVHPGDSDYLYLIDSNVGFNKVDSVIKRSLTYQVDLSDFDHPTSKVTLVYQHTGTGNTPCFQVASYGNGTYQDMQQRCYWDYWRVYTPLGSEIISSTAQPVAADNLLNGKGWSGQVESYVGEANTQVFAGLLLLPVSQSTQVSISYSLPLHIVERLATNLYKYSLIVQVQPGLEGLPITIKIKVPNSSLLLDLPEGWTYESPQTWTWQGVLDQPMKMDLSIQNNATP
jgi:hypothetical protein